MKIKSYLIAALIICSISSLSAQTYEVFFVERTVGKTQTDATTTALIDWDAPYAFFAGLNYDVDGATPSNLTVTNGTDTETLTAAGDPGEFEFEAPFNSLAELDAGVLEATYTFKQGTTDIASIVVGARNLPDAQLVNEYVALQSIDPTQDITIT